MSDLRMVPPTKCVLVHTPTEEPPLPPEFRIALVFTENVPSRFREHIAGHLFWRRFKKRQFYVNGFEEGVRSGGIRLIGIRDEETEHIAREVCGVVPRLATLPVAYLEPFHIIVTVSVIEKNGEMLFFAYEHTPKELAELRSQSPRA